MSRENLSDTDLYFVLFDLPTENGQCHVPDWALYRCDQTIRLLKEMAAGYGLPRASVSAFIRAFNELRNAGIIKPVRSADPFKVSPEETLTAAQYNAMPASQIVVRYRSDESFRAGVDSLIARGLI